MQSNQKTQIFISSLLNKNIKLCVAESITGGRFAYELVKYTNASKIFDYSIVTYSNESKIKILGIADKEVNDNVISKEVAKQMVEKVSKFSVCKKVLSLSCTGQAGPKLLDNHQNIGTVFIGVKYNNSLKIIEKNFTTGNRKEIIKQTVTEMIEQGNIIINN